MRDLSLGLVLFGLWGLGCSSEALDSDGGSGPGSDPSGEALADRAEAVLGTEGNPDSIDLVVLWDSDGARSATALEFDPTRPGELWVTLRQLLTELPCTMDVTTGCAALQGQIALIQDATSADPRVQIKQDGNAWHFMRRPTSIAFGTNGYLATCGEARTGNYEDEVADFNGPVLWSSDPTIFGVEPEPGQNGTHVDMLHESPYCMGIAHETGNVYWTFDGAWGSLDRYDFNLPHEVGGEDHSDGSVWRYVEGEVSRVPEVPSHLFLDKSRGELYVADTGGGRILRLDIKSGTPDGDILAYDPIAVHLRMSNATLDEVVAPGVLDMPSGIVFYDDVLFVTDYGTGMLHAFDRSGEVLASVDTGLGPGVLGGITIGPDGKAYLTDLKWGRAYRLELR